MEKPRKTIKIEIFKKKDADFFGNSEKSSTFALAIMINAYNDC